MKKLTMLLAIALAPAIGCKSDKQEAPPAPIQKPIEQTPTTPTTPPPAATPTAPDKMATPADKLPMECVDYKAAIDRLASCDKLPAATKDSLKKAYDQQAASWTSTPADQKDKLGPSCKASVDAVNAAAKLTCGW